MKSPSNPIKFMVNPLGNRHGNHCIARAPRRWSPVKGCITRDRGVGAAANAKAVMDEGVVMLSDERCIYIYIPLTISTTKRVNTCLVPSSDSWIIQAKKMDPCTSFCSKRVCTVSCSGVPFGTHKSETHFVVIYFGMRCVTYRKPQSPFLPVMLGPRA